MYLYLALFWLALGVLVQVFWTHIEAVSRFDRTFMAVIFLVLFSYNIFRWRMQRMTSKERELDDHPLTKRRHGEREYNPDLDFTRPDEPKPPEPGR